MKAHIDIRYTYDLPDDPDTRETWYGTTDPLACVWVDVANGVEELASTGGVEVTVERVTVELPNGSEHSSREPIE